jgi:chitosanase
MLPTQISTAKAIVNIFETGVVLGDYGDVTVIAGDTGHLTFGRSQTTLGSGNLADLLQRYCDNSRSRFAARLAPWLPRMRAKDFSLDGETRLHNLLRATADDPLMRDIQDQFFDEVYWQPAARAADRSGIQTALGVAVVYDSTVHGSWSEIRDLTIQQKGTLATLTEGPWVTGYVAVRRNWLATSPRSDLRACVYRMDAFQRLIDQDRWSLDLPLVVRGQEISLPTLSAVPPGCYDGPQPGTRPLSVQSPLARGLDVRLLQVGLSEAGADIKADGVFGQHSGDCVRSYQAANGLAATGVADLGLVAKLAT